VSLDLPLAVDLEIDRHLGCGPVIDQLSPTDSKAQPLPALFGYLDRKRAVPQRDPIG
jgi:hypothetical protein